MSYYLEVPHFSQRFITVDIPAPTDNAGYNFEIEFECQLTATDLILNGTTNASSNNICFLKASVLEYRNSPNSSINMTHGVNAQDWHVYRLVFTGSGQGNIAFYVDGVFKSNYTPSASIATPAFTALLHLSGATRTGNFRYFKFTDFNNAASNRMYDARAHVPSDLVLRDTANGQDGSFSANGSAWAALSPNFVFEGGATTATSAIAAGLPTPSAASTVNVQSTTASFTVAAGLPVPTASSAVTIVPAAGDPIFTSEPLYNNTNGATGLLANTLLDYVAIYSNTSPRNLIFESANVTTDANGRFSVQSALLTSGASYKVDWQVNSTGVSRMPVKAAV